MLHHFFRLLAASLAAWVLVPAVAGAQSPFKDPIRIVVPYAAGGGADVGARMLSAGLSKELGQTMIVDNRPGASGQIGTALVQQAAPDGRTVMFTVDHSLIVVPLTLPGARYDVSRDFESLGLGFRSAWVLTVSADAPYQDFVQYAAALKEDEALRLYGTTYVGGAPEAVGNAVGRALGIEMTPVPFAGTVPALMSVVAGHTPASVTGLPEAVKLQQAGKARIIGITGPVRSPILPDVPTFKELGVPGLEPVRSIMAFFAPKGFPPAMASAFNAALRKVLADPRIHDQLLEMALEPASTSIEEATREIDEVQKFWKAEIASVER